MTMDPRHTPAHTTDLLAAYANGSLGAAAAERVRQHLDRCPACQQELAAWMAIREAAQLAAAPA
nr:zf-HC2 domain-containing protein [Ktedonobacterales bacterium]